MFIMPRNRFRSLLGRAMDSSRPVRNNRMNSEYPSVMATSSLAAPAVYDQRQSGNSNIRIDVKDAVLIAIADEFGDYDYTYDYSDLTIKPEEPSSTTTTTTTTSMPSTTTATTTTTAAAKPIPVQNASVVIHPDNSSLTIVSKPGNETVLVHKHPPLNSQDYQIPVIVVHDVKENTKLLPVKILEKSAPSLVGSNSTDEVPQLRHCSQGFFLDSHNRCKRIRKPPAKLKP